MGVVVRSLFMGNSQALGARSTGHDVRVFFKPDLSGKRAIVTGANSGIGYDTARQLALAGCEVILACRDEKRGRECEQRLLADINAYPAEKSTKGTVAYVHLDLSSFASVRRFALEQRASGKPLHLLINNAGVMGAAYRLTEDGFESTWQTNHLSHFLLTLLLRECLLRGAPSRVINVSSRAIRASDIPIDFARTTAPPESEYAHLRQYGRSKMANVMFSRALQQKWGPDGVSSASLHPGVVATNLGHETWWMKAGYTIGAIGLMKSPEQGASTTLTVAMMPELPVPGGFYSDCMPVHGLAPLSYTQDDDTLWQKSLEWTKFEEAEIELKRALAASSALPGVGPVAAAAVDASPSPASSAPVEVDH